MKKIKYLLLITLLLTGCQNYRELNDIAITTAASIDYSPITNEYTIITQVVNTVKQDDVSSSNEPTFLNFTSTSSSLTEAMSKIVLESPRKLYISQTQILVLSKEVIENKLDSILDYALRNPEIRGEIKVLVAPDKEDLKGITIQTLLDSLSSSNTLSSLEEAEKDGYVISVTLNDLTEMYLNPYKEIILPSIYIEGNLNEAQNEDNKSTTNYKGTVKLGKMAIFKDNKLLDFLSFDEAKYLGLIRGTINKTNIKLDYNDGYIVFEPYEIKTKISPNIKKNKISLDITGKAKSYEIITNSNIEDKKEVKELQDYLNKKIEESILNTFNSIKNKYNTDIFNFRNIYYQNNPNYLKNNYSSWYEEVFPNLELQVESKLQLYEKGKIKEEIKYAKENR